MVVTKTEEENPWLQEVLNPGPLPYIFIVKFHNHYTINLDEEAIVKFNLLQYKIQTFHNKEI
jgi:hypothetical protein